jgi:hypothetical protein
MLRLADSTATNRLVRRSLALKSMRATPPAARLGPTPQPFHLAPHLIGQRFLAAGLRAQKLFLLFQEVAVTSLHPKNALRISAADLGHIVHHVVQKVAVVAHHHAGKGRRAEQLLQP